MKQILFIPLFCLLISTFVLSQEPVDSQEPLDPQEPEVSQEADVEPTAAEIEKLTRRLDDTIANFRTVVREAQEMGFKYVNALTLDEASGMVEDFYSKVEEGNQIRDQIVPLAEKLFELKVAGTERADDELAHLATRVMQFLFKQGEFGRAYRLANRLIANNPDNDFAKVYFARAAAMTNDFSERVEKIYESQQKHFEENESIGESEKLLLYNLAVMRKLYDSELAIRKTEAEADDLPRVKFTTEKGEFVAELFENEAPQTVANFISLVEAGHFDGVLFHTVIKQTAAETGIATEDGVRELDYTIYDECNKPNARMNFSGSLTMVSEKPNTGSSRFFVSLAPLPSFNKKRTVFGRILTGMDTVYRLHHTHKIDKGEQIQIEGYNPDKVISAEVIRKRDHEYKPTKVKK